MLLNLDIWHEVINHLDYPKDQDTLSSLAVTSRCLSNLALGALWRNGENAATKVVSVLNSFAPSPNEPFLEYIQEHGGDTGESDDEHGGDTGESDDEHSPTPPSERVGSWVSFSWLSPTQSKLKLGGN